MFPNGIIMNNWTPLAEGANFEFKATMKPLEAFREHLNALSGLAQVQGRALGDGAGDHARAGATFLTGVHPKKSEITLRAGISADQIAAQELSQYTQFGSSNWALNPTNSQAVVTAGIAVLTPTQWPGVMKLRRYLWRTIRVRFSERLFGEGDSTDAAARLAQFNRQRSLLDYVNGSLNDWALLWGAGSRKLNEYTDAIRDIERRIQKAEAQNASMKML